jgi:hypothetical protein
MVPRVRLDTPIFLTVTVLFEVLPSKTLPKSTEVGVTVISGPDLPARFTVIVGSSGSSEAIVKLEVNDPAMSGANWTMIEHLPPGMRTLPLVQLPPILLKGLAGSPMVPRVRLRVPSFLTVMVFCKISPSETPPKSTVAGVTAISG